ncbi:hypothetical protein A3842_03740 [Paenibacillus sp. P3E]|nr:hypothetical protein A3842_03740 [Paenibacillus sp. P3E]
MPLLICTLGSGYAPDFGMIMIAIVIGEINSCVGCKVGYMYFLHPVSLLWCDKLETNVIYLTIVCRSHIFLLEGFHADVFPL